jgi:hypothetical protein
MSFSKKDPSSQLGWFEKIGILVVFLPLGVITCVHPFEQLVERSVDHLQESISEILHNHSFIIIFYLPSYLHQAHLKSCVGLNAGG